MSRQNIEIDPETFAHVVTLLGLAIVDALGANPSDDGYGASRKIAQIIEELGIPDYLNSDDLPDAAKGALEEYRLALGIWSKHDKPAT